MSKVDVFRKLHHGPLFIMPNAWCAGSARMIEAQGFTCLGTTSAGIAYAHAYRDSSPGMGVDLKLSAIKLITDAVNLPVSADLENVFAPDLEGIAAFTKDVIGLGCAGLSIEDIADYSSAENPVFYSLDQAAERVEAVCKMAKKIDPDFVVTARTDILLSQQGFTLDDVLARLRAFEEAGADCLFAPGLRSMEQVDAIRQSSKLPLNVLPNASMSLASLREAGVARVSLGSALFRSTYAGIAAALDSIKNDNDFKFMQGCLDQAALDRMMR